MQIKKHWALIAIIILAAALRLWHLTSISLWHDEAFSTLLINYSWREMFYRIALDVHPPAYYVALRLWHYIFGDSLWSLRGFSALFGVLGAPAAYLFVKQTFQNHKAAILAALLIAVSPFQILFVTEARMYTFGAFFAILAAYFLSKALRAQREYYQLGKLNQPNLPEAQRLKQTFIRHHALFAFAAAVIMYTHYYLLFTAAALMFYALVYHFYHYRDNFKKYGWLILSWLMIGLLYLPWLPTFFAQLKQVSTSYWIPPMDRWSIPATVWQMLFGIDTDTSKTSARLLVSLGLIFSLFLLYRFAKRAQAPEKWLVILAILAPFGGALMFLALSKLSGSGTSVFLVRYFLFAAVFYSIALAVWLSQMPRKKIAGILLGAYAILNLWALGHYWKNLNLPGKPGMAGAAKFLRANVEPKDLLISGSSFEFFNLKYYLAQYPPFNSPPNLGGEAGGVRPALYSGGNTEVKNLPHFAGTALLTNEDLLPDFKAAVKKDQLVWLIWTNGFGGSKPEIPANWTQLDERAFAEVRPYPGTNIYVDKYRVN